MVIACSQVAFYPVGELMRICSKANQSVLYKWRGSQPFEKTISAAIPERLQRNSNGVSMFVCAARVHEQPTLGHDPAIFALTI
jgi:hypothetical protein